ncbi:hypothetical protein BD769DRAFT_1396427 [Suillus cothurnatus]|nr:hypothetical protein BD769DRAFT_1396427 [Suillus cothurnatus]
MTLKGDICENTSVGFKKIDVSGPSKYGNWEEFIHLLGGTYYYHRNKRMYTQKINNFVIALQAVAQENKWVLVVHPTMFRGEEKFQYYYVVLDQHLIAWIEELNGYLLFWDCVLPSEWEHKRLELEAQYWKHFEFFPQQSLMDVSVARSIQREVICYLGAGSIFWTQDQMNQIITHLAGIETEELADNGLIHETGIVSCCRILYILSTVFCMPITIDSVKRTSIDGIINGVEVRNFVNNLSSQTRNQITLAGVSMALDIAILAVPGTMRQHFGDRMRSIDFAV